MGLNDHDDHLPVQIYGLYLYLAMYMSVVTVLEYLIVNARAEF